MSYQPPDQPPPGGTPGASGTPDMYGTPGNQGAPDNAPGSPTLPTGGYTPPPGGYTPPPPPPPGDQPGGYTPPPGGYTPPPGGYVPPPGGYAPPPPGGYPPPPGGYGAPPPVGYGGPIPPTGSEPFNIQQLLQGWIGAVTRPSFQFFQSQLPRASWLAILVGLATVVIVRLVLGLLTAGAYADLAARNADQARRQLQGSGLSSSSLPGLDLNLVSGSGLIGAFSQIITTPLGFFIGAGILYLSVGIFGGRRGDFMVHTYFLSLSWVPTRLLMTVVNLGDLAGTVLALVVSLLLLAILLYQAYCAGKSFEVAHGMEPGKAQQAAFVPFGIGILVLCLCIVVGVVVAGFAIAGLVNR